MRIKNALGGVLLIAGTCVGAGTLALPMSMAHMSYTATISMFMLTWIFMTISALLMLEANLRIAPGTNLVTMAMKSLGEGGKIVAWIAYLFLFYSLTAAYINAACAWLSALLTGLTGYSISLTNGAILFTLVIAAIVHAGPKAADWTNRLLMAGLGIAFLSLLIDTGSYVSLDAAISRPGTHDIFVLPILLTTFGFHIVIPTLTTYIECDKKLKNIIIFGSLIPLVIYILWQTWVFSLLSSSALNDIAASSAPTVALTNALEALSENPRIGFAANALTIFVISTSFIGVALSLFDFIADALKFEKTGSQRFMLTLITLAPPLSIVLLFPQGFLFALSFAGIFVAILLGIYPVLMVWRARYQMTSLSDYAVFGGKPILVLTLLFFTSVVFIEIVRLAS